MPDEVSKKILIVEDEDDHYELVLRGFSQTSALFTIERAKSILEARQKISSVLPDLIIADWKLPDGDGIELIEKDSPIGSKYPVIVMTSHGNESWAVEAMRLGALDYIVKSPQAFSELERSVTRALREWNNIAERKKAEQEREKLIVELRDALAKVKLLSGMLPICASCKKIRDDKGYWNQIESYISEHSDVLFSHGLCPDCGKRYHEELEEMKKKEIRNNEGS